MILFSKSRAFTVVAILSVTLTIILGCASTGPAKSKPPEWVFGKSQSYPNNQYLTGVGYGVDREAAENKARAEISKIFIARIKQRSYEFEQYLQIASKGKTESTQAVDIQQVTMVSTEKILSGVQIVDHYIDKSSRPRTHYALAVLNRLQAQNSLKEKISKLDTEISELVSKADYSRDILQKIQALKKAISKMVMREAYNEEMRIVNTRGAGINSRMSLESLKSKMANVLKDQFNLAISISGPYKNQIKNALTEGMTQLGFVFNPNPSRASVLIKGNVSLEPADIPHKTWKFMRWSVDFEMIDRRSGKVFGSVTSSGREGHITQSEAEKRAVRKMKKKLTDEVGAEVSDYIFGQ